MEAAMNERVVGSNKQQAPPLQSRIVTVLDNPNASASELSELVAETELAIVTADEVIASERASAADLISTPSADSVQQAISRAEAAKINRDRLSGVLPKLRDRYTAALATERRDRWASDYKKVEAASDKLLQEYKDIDQAYRSAKAERDKLIRRMQDCDLDVERVNAAACDLDIWDLRLEPLLETMQPELKWGAPRISNGSLAVACAQAMMPPSYNPADWSKPDVRAQQRAEAEKQQREMASYYEQATKDQEARQNEEDRAQFAKRTP
jgi:hypothetical protein